jgi:hypothetical protein
MLPILMMEGDVEHRMEDADEAEAELDEGV